MYYAYNLTATKGTTEGTALEEVIKIGPGMIHHFELVFPSGSAGLSHVQIFDELHQVYPTNEGESFTGDNIHHVVKEFYEPEGKTARLTAKYWNTDDTYDHSIIVMFGVLPKWVLLPQVFAHSVKRGFDALIGIKGEI